MNSKYLANPKAKDVMPEVTLKKVIGIKTNHEGLESAIYKLFSYCMRVKIAEIGFEIRANCNPGKLKRYY